MFSVIRRFWRRAMSKVCWSRTERMLRPRRSTITSKMMLATSSPLVLDNVSSSNSEPAVCGRSPTRSEPGTWWCFVHIASHSSSTLFGTSVWTRCWCCVEPSPIALVAAVPPEEAMSAASKRGPPTSVWGVR